MKRSVVAFSFLLITLLLYSQDRPVVYNASEPKIGWSNNVILFHNGQFISVLQHDLASGYTYGYWNQYDNILELKGYPRIGHLVDITATTKYNSEFEGSTAIYLDNEYPIVVEYNGKKMRLFPFKGASCGEFLPFRAETIWIEYGILPHAEQMRIELYDSINNRYNNVVMIDVDDTHTIQRNPYQKYVVLDSCTIYELSSGREYIRRDSVSADRFLKRVLTENVLTAIDEHNRSNPSIMRPIAYSSDTLVPNMTRFMIKYEQNRCRLNACDITGRILNDFNGDSALDCEGKYIMLVNFLMGNCEECTDKISQQIYNELVLHPQKMELLYKYISFLPNNEFKIAGEKCIMLLAREHSKRITQFDEEQFYTRFPSLRTFPNSGFSHLKGIVANTFDTMNIIEKFRELNNTIENDEVFVYLKGLSYGNLVMATLSEIDYAFIILYLSKCDMYNEDDVKTKLYEFLYLYPNCTNLIDHVLSDLSDKESSGIKENFAKIIAIEYSKQNELFYENDFYNNFPVMEQYKKYIDTIIETTNKRYFEKIFFHRR